MSPANTKSRVAPPPELGNYPVGSPEWRWLEGYGGLQECAELAGVSEDSLKRNHPEKIKRLGPRRLGMKRKHALSLGTPIEISNNT
jgi:hypothetical protein